MVLPPTLGYGRAAFVAVFPPPPTVTIARGPDLNELKAKSSQWAGQLECNLCLRTAALVPFGALFAEGVNFRLPDALVAA